jgi:hypothetical protein
VNLIAFDMRLEITCDILPLSAVTKISFGFIKYFYVIFPIGIKD